MDNYDPFAVVDQLKEWIEQKFSSLNTDALVEAKSRYRTIVEIIDKYNKLNMPVSEDIQTEKVNLEHLIDAPIEDKRRLNSLAVALLSLSKDIKYRLQKMRSRKVTIGTKAPPMKLRITFSDGTVIFEKNATETFIKSLQYIGLQKISELKSITISGYPLVSIYENKYSRQVRNLDGYFIETHSSTKQKAHFLDSIGNLLHVDILIDIVEG